ncbi:microfibril-associated glycoprotein 4-like [Littorina saxatilis]|uniref:microfibril-associated glycoprotein 4-like n=1 Tax=Littorina saxatilis TaxID=31220 RepID=UPI0038B6615E
MPTLLPISVALLCVTTVATLGNTYKNIGHNGKAFIENVIFESRARSTLHCAVFCDQQECCLTFTFDGDVCRGHGNMGMFNTSSFADDSGARTFSTGKLDKNALNYKPKDCVEAGRCGGKSGVVTIYPDDDNTGLQVYCDQDTEGGGWLVFQRRQNGSVDFYRKWNMYKHGFGSLDGEFWLGLDALHVLTSRQIQDLRVDLMKFDGTRGNASFSNFVISDSSDNYRLHFDGFTGGKAGNSLAVHNGMQFSTRDADNDINDGENCAAFRQAAWWFASCDDSNLNGHYMSTRMEGDKGVLWDTFDGGFSLKFSEMKMRPSLV